MRALALLLAITGLLCGCGGAPGTAPGAGSGSAPGAAAGESAPAAASGESEPLQNAIEAVVADRGIDYSCRSDADCTIKDVGNCCGYYPACVNQDSPTFPDRVKAECAAEGRMAVCGYPEISGCSCVEGRCTDVAGIAVGDAPVQ